MTEAIKLSDLKLSLPVDTGGEIEILKGINFELPTATKCGLIGPSGSGKTSLLTIIAGLRPPSSGDISILSKVLKELSEEELASFRRDNIGIVFQNFHLLPTMTALENVALPLELTFNEQAEDLAAAALKLVGLDHRTSHYPHQLSGGEQQRTAIARAFVAKPKLILADEPTGNLDSKTSENIMEILNNLTKENDATMLLITHNEDILANFDKVIKMQDGNLIA